MSVVFLFFFVVFDGFLYFINSIGMSEMLFGILFVCEKFCSYDSYLWDVWV